MEDDKVIALGVIKKNRAIPGQKITVSSDPGKTLGKIVKVFQ